MRATPQCALNSFALGVSWSRRFSSNQNPNRPPPTFSNINYHDQFVGNIAEPIPTIHTPKGAPNFDDFMSAYKHLSAFDIVRTLAVLRLCRVEVLTANAVGILVQLQRVFGEYLTYETVVRWTMFKQFCAGSNEHEIKFAIKRLNQLGVGSILDYAAEADVPSDSKVSSGLAQPPSRSMKTLLKTTDIPYDPEEEDTYDINMKLYLMCVSHASLNIPKSGAGFAAVKLTGMCDPRLLSRITAILLNVRKIWCEMCGSECTMEESRVVINNNTRSERRFLTREVVGSFIPKYAPGITEVEIAGVLDFLDPDKDGFIDYLHYVRAVAHALNNQTDDTIRPLLPFVRHLPQLTAVEVKYFHALCRRLNVICRVAVDLKVRVMMDAEQTFYQTAIDHIVRNLQREYNTEFPHIYNTYQCYLTYSPDRIDTDLARAKAEGWVWAGKIVRGAYMNQERATAAEYGYQSPIWPDIEGTHKCYNACADVILKEVEKSDKIGVLFGTHNRASLEFITKRLIEKNISGSNVSFAQLYGMADYLTMPLKQSGFSVFKYVPYGPVKETIHYLSRRAQENSGMLASGSESSLLWSVLKSRVGLK